MKTIEKSFPAPVWKPSKRAKVFIWIISVALFLVKGGMNFINVEANLGFNPNDFALLNAILNSMIVVLLISGLVAVKRQKYILHKKILIFAIVLTVLFLVSYVIHHLFAGDAKFGDLNHDGSLSISEKSEVGGIRYLYYFILWALIPLAVIVLPFILFTIYRSLTGKYVAHAKLARITWPIWLYVSITGVLVYIFTSPYY